MQDGKPTFDAEKFAELLRNADIQITNPDELPDQLLQYMDACVSMPDHLTVETLLNGLTRPSLSIGSLYVELSASMTSSESSNHESSKSNSERARGTETAGWIEPNGSKTN